jgi:hypothetical protein
MKRKAGPAYMVKDTASKIVADRISYKKED